jgi:hypothetical protein
MSKSSPRADNNTKSRRYDTPILDQHCLLLGPITYSTQIIKPHPSSYTKRAITKYTFVCMIPHNITFTYTIKTILRTYLTQHIHILGHRNTSFHVSSITNMLFIYSENIAYILSMLKEVKHILNCSSCVSNNLPKKYMKILNT